MKLNKIFGGMICLALLASCGDEMDYHEYTDYDSKYVFTNSIIQQASLPIYMVS